MSLIFLIALPLLMYFLLIRPQQRRAKEQRELLSAVAEGDEIMTTGGLFGYVNAVEDDVIWLDIAEGVEIRIARGAVARRIPVAESSAETKDATVPDDAPAAAGPSTNGSAPDLPADVAEETPKAGPEAER